jgi:DNA-directed RNA polymerase specialized sigma24 family protein
LAHSGDLWRLLVAITLHKLRRQVQHHQAGKRALNREDELQRLGGPTAFEAETLARDPSPIEAAALTDELEQIMRGMDVHRRRMLELRLQGYTLEEIARDTRHSLRTVRRRLEQIKQSLEQRYQEHNSS